MEKVSMEINYNNFVVEVKDQFQFNSSFLQITPQSFVIGCGYSFVRAQIISHQKENRDLPVAGKTW